MKPPIKRCAIYTRKSSEEGLDQEFNSLDAQRESCLAYIISQKSEGWTSVKTLYDDGGFSGGNMGRPALKQLIADIKARKIDTIVVYKIDRLTRSLMDFSKLVEVFDEYAVTFVSVTQSFNTTTSMGRLTLNVLLSFAQFEREVTGERIRDKIAASKKKGMWMGGTIPLGYDVENRQLIVNRQEAETIKIIFAKYLELGNVLALKKYLDSINIKTKVNQKENGVRGGRFYSPGNLYHTLVNPIYIGKVRHKEQVYEGQHEAIINLDVWERVQQKLQDQSVKPRKNEYIRIDKLLSKKLFDCEGNCYTPCAANKGNKQYRYYVSQNLIQNRSHPNNVIARLPAEQMEKTVVGAIKGCLTNLKSLREITNIKSEDDKALHFIKDNVDDVSVAEIIKLAMIKGEVHPDTLEIHLSKPTLISFLSQKLKINLPEPIDKIHIESIPFRTRRGDRVMIVTTPSDQHDPFDRTPTELKNWVRGILWRDEFYSGLKIEQIAKRENLSARYVGRLIDASLDLPAA